MKKADKSLLRRLIRTIVWTLQVSPTAPDSFQSHERSSCRVNTRSHSDPRSPCRNLAPVYEQLADAFPTGKVVIAKLDADGAGKHTGKRFSVKGYPSESRDSHAGC